MMCIALCPLAKIFQPYFTVYDAKMKPKEIVTREQLMKSPERIYEEESFGLVIDREVGAFNMVYNQPKNIPDLLLRTWLVGGTTGAQVQETDCYGVVELPLDQDTSAAMTYFVAHGRTPDKEVLQSIQDAREKAKKLSHDRVMRQIRSVNNAMRRQYELNEEQKLGDFVPSPVEYLCTYALAEEQTKSQADLQAVKSRFKELMSLTATR